VADIIAYVNHDIDDAVRAGVLDTKDLPQSAVSLLGDSSGLRINSMVTDVVNQTLAGGLTEIRMSEPVLQATLDLREFLFQAVYENPRATAEFEKAAGVLGGLWDKLRQSPAQFLDPVTIETEGLDAAARDFLAGMTDRYAVALFEDLFVPRSWSV
jgi:dGTPase